MATATLMPVVEVRATEVGLGVFAGRHFEEDSVVSEIHGEVVCGPDYQSDYCMDLGGDFRLEPGEPYRFLNHSCNPNCELFQWESDDPEENEEYARKMWLGALRDIQPGEELTIDYGWTAENAIPCQCGSVECRGWVVAEDEIDRLNELLEAWEEQEEFEEVAEPAMVQCKDACE